MTKSEYQIQYDYLCRMTNDMYITTKFGTELTEEDERLLSSIGHIKKRIDHILETKTYDK